MIDLDTIWSRWINEVGLSEIRPDFRFDPEHYAVYAPHSDNNQNALRSHYQDEGRISGATPNVYRDLHAHNPEIDSVIAKLLTDEQLLKAVSVGVPHAHELAYELMHLGDPVVGQISDFSHKAYLATYPDLVEGTDPLRHYVLHGVSEGRHTLARLRASQYPCQRPFNPGFPTCMIAIHECSRTGAPMVGLDLVREASRTHNVVVAALRGGEVLDRFQEYACELVVTDNPLVDFSFYRGEAFNQIKFAITNSVECFRFSPLLVAREIPFAAYIHEYADYIFPLGKTTFTALFTDLLVFTSEHVRDSWAGRLKDIEFNAKSDTAIIPQRVFSIGFTSTKARKKARQKLSKVLGRTLTDVRLVCGAGLLQWRKGVDTFMQTAQIARSRDPDTVFVWIGDGLDAEDPNFGTWIAYHMKQIRANEPDQNLFFIPAGLHYLDILAASDVMFLSSRLDPLPNVVFDALDYGCSIVLYENATGFNDDIYRQSGQFSYVEYGNPDAAVTAITKVPRKPSGTPSAHGSGKGRGPLFSQISSALQERLVVQHRFVRGASALDVPMVFSAKDHDKKLRIREREKTMRYGRRFLWRDKEEAEHAIRSSGNWVHQNMGIAPYSAIAIRKSPYLANPDHILPAISTLPAPDFSIHVHAFYTDELQEDVRRYSTYHHAQRIVITTDTEKKAVNIQKIMQCEGLSPEIVLVDNRGRDILPFLELFTKGGVAGKDEIWCHLHQKKSLATTRVGDIWRTFLMDILLGDENTVSGAIELIGQTGTGLVAPFDPYHIGWNASRALIPKFEKNLPHPLPDLPLLFPVGNMFWVRREVVLEMSRLFGTDYPWPNEPIANDGTEFHMIERLWPAMAAVCDLKSVFVHKPDQRRA